VTWFGLAARLVLAGVWLVAGGSKVGDVAESVRAVHAYDLMPYSLSQIVGAALPFVELALGVLVLIGFATRFATGVSAALLSLFVAGIASAWARGLRIDCGCFGGGGELAAGKSPTYFWEIARDVALLALALYLLFRPRSRLAIDNALAAGPDDDDETLAEGEEHGEKARSGQ
jgi:uncharacterized membrane protein YphA (DoxX/SURF4 family)